MMVLVAAERVVQHVIVYAPNRTDHWNPPWDIIVPDWIQPRLTDGPCVYGRCNATHSTEYCRSDDERSQGAGDTAHTVRVRMWHYGSVPRPPRRRAPADVLLFMTMEPPIQLDFDSVAGYDGEVSYRRDAAVWRPLSRWVNVWGHARKLRFEPAERDSIGIWNDYCNSPLRNPVIAALLGSGLNVESYGACSRNRPAVGSVLARDRTALRACHKHRLMVAVQHTACRDYISDNLHIALKCGAVPIINRIGGVPDYEAILGRFPHVDASRPGWLQTVRAIMEDNATYARFLNEAAAAAKPPQTMRSLERDGGYHCQFHDAHRRLEPQPPNASWSVVRAAAPKMPRGGRTEGGGVVGTAGGTGGGGVGGGGTGGGGMGSRAWHKRVQWEQCFVCRGTERFDAVPDRFKTIVDCPASTHALPTVNSMRLRPESPSTVGGDQ